MFLEIVAINFVAMMAVVTATVAQNADVADFVAVGAAVFAVIVVEVAVIDEKR